MLKLTKKSFLMFANLILFTTSFHASAFADSNYNVVGYYANWSSTLLSQLPLQNVDLVNYAFLQLNQDGTVGSVVNSSDPNYDKTATWSSTDINNLSTIPALKTQFNVNGHELKFVVSIGGWTRSENFSAIAASQALTQNFVNSVSKMLTDYPGIDGVDIDWEYPISGGDNIPHSPDDKKNYVNLVKALRTKLDSLGKSHYLITIAGPHNSKQNDMGSVDNVDVKNMLQYIDAINIMAYDIHQSTSEPTMTNVDAALYQSPMDPAATKGDDSVSDSINDYKKQGLSQDELHKLVMGIPLYGFAWTGVEANGLDPYFPGLYASATGPLTDSGSTGAFTYNMIQSTLIAEKNLQSTCSSTYFFCSYYSASSKVFLTADNALTVSNKANFIKTQGLGGAMFWELSGDTYDQYSLVYNTRKALGLAATIPTPPPAVWKTQLTNTAPAGKPNAVYTIVINGSIYEALNDQGATPGPVAPGNNVIVDSSSNNALKDIQAKYGAGPFQVMITPNANGKDDGANAFMCKDQMTLSTEQTINIMANPDPAVKACDIKAY